MTVFTVWHATAALAQPAVPKKLNDKEKAEARALYDEGLRHYNVAEYADAVTAFKGAYLLSGDPKLLFDVAQSYRLSGDCEQALRFYKNFKREAPDAPNLAEVDAAISKCEAAPPAPAAAAPPERPVVAEASVPAPAPAISPVAPPAVVPLAPVEVSQAAPEKDPGHGKRVAGMALGAVGVAAAATGVALGLSGSAQLRQLHEKQGEWGPDEKRSEADAQRRQTAGQIAIGVGAASMVAGVTVYLMGNSERRSSSHLALGVGRRGEEVVWSCAF